MLDMLVQICHLGGALCKLLGHHLELLSRKIDINGETSLRAVLDPVLCNACINIVRRVHIEENLVPQILSLDLSISLVEKGARNCNLQVHNTGYISRIDYREILLIRPSKGS